MKTIQLLLFLFLTNFAVGQVAFLDEYDFEKGGYYLLGARAESDPNDLADSLGEWYTDDISVLNEFKSEWVFTEPGKHYACGYHYIVYLCINGKALERFAINLNCNEIVGDKGYFYFETDKLSKFKGKLKTPNRDSRTFESVDVARISLANCLIDSNLIYTPIPDWNTYEGTFTFDYDCVDENYDCLENEEEILEMLKIEIQSKYLEEKFEIESHGGSNSEVFVEILCNKSLEEKFDLYERDSEYDQWDPLRLNLTVYWIK